MRYCAVPGTYSIELIRLGNAPRNLTLRVSYEPAQLKIEYDRTRLVPEVHSVNLCIVPS